MHSLGGKLSKQRWPSGRKPADALVPEPDRPENLAKPAAPETPGAQKVPKTPPHVLPRTASTSLSPSTPESLRIHNGSIAVPSPTASSLDMPLIPASEHGSAATRTSSIPSTEKISCVSSRVPSSSGFPTLSLPPSSTSRQPRHSQAYDDRPPWDRNIELVWTRHIPELGRVDRKNEDAFRENLERLAQNTTLNTQGKRASGTTTFPSQDKSLKASPSDLLPRKKSQNADCRYLQLPDTVRFKIMKYLLASHSQLDKPIRMNNPVYLWEVWPVNRLRAPKVWSTDYFDSLQNVLSSIDNYTSVCSSMRADVLATLFLTRRFHVVYAPYVGTETQPAATHYMDRYGPLMSSITLEVDFTKLAGSWRPEAVHLNALEGLKGVKSLLETFVQRQLTRRNTTIQDLRVLVRRYHGLRPTTPPTSNSPATPSFSPAPSPSQTNNPPPTEYTPTPLISHTLSPLKSLGPLVTTLTITGASQCFITELLLALRGRTAATFRHHSDEKDQANKEMGQHVTYRVPAVEYPLLLGQRAVVASGDGDGDGGGVVVVAGCEAGMGEWVGEYGCRFVGLGLGLDGGGGGDGGGDGGEQGECLRRKKRGRVERVLGGRLSGGLGVLSSKLRSRDGKEKVGRVGGDGGLVGGGHEGNGDQEAIPGGKGREKGAHTKEGRSRQRTVPQRVLKKIASGSGKGLFGHF